MIRLRPPAVIVAAARGRPAVTGRHGVAAVELAAVFLFFIVPLMIGVWEVGRLVQVQQLVSTSAREGARLAAQGYTVGSSGSPTEIRVEPHVRDAVYHYLVSAGLTNLRRSDVTVTFQFLAPRTTGPNQGMTPAEPYQGEKNQPFSVTVSVPWEKVRWVNLGLVRPTRVTYTVTWQMLTDDRFTVNETLPSW